MKEIILTQGKVALVDDEDYDYLNDWNWCYQKDRLGGGYAVRTDRTNGQRTISMHRVILERMGYKNFTRTDHINQNGIDNQRYNLRPATASQNGYNQKKHKNNTSGYKGVTWQKQNKKWAAHIQVDRKKIHVGYFNNIKDAVKARDEAVKKHHKEFGVLNTP